ncbi:MAG: hypothetical protein ACM34J_07095 [Ignavibacteria bacterium]
MRTKRISIEKAIEMINEDITIVPTVCLNDMMLYSFTTTNKRISCLFDKITAELVKRTNIL